MQPEVVLKKKFARGIPAYKIKWKDSTKQLATWQWPPFPQSLKNVINNFEKKCWGSNLDELFFNENLYRQKFHVKKQKNKKNLVSKKAVIQQKKIEKAMQHKEQQEVVVQKGKKQFYEAKKNLFALKCLNILSQNRKYSPKQALVQKNQPSIVNSKKEKKISQQKNQKEKASLQSSLKENVMKIFEEKNNSSKINQKQENRFPEQDFQQRSVIMLSPKKLKEIPSNEQIMQISKTKFVESCSRKTSSVNKILKVFRINSINPLNEMFLVEYVGGKLMKKDSTELKKELITNLYLNWQH